MNCIWNENDEKRVRNRIMLEHNPVEMSAQ